MNTLVSLSVLPPPITRTRTFSNGFSCNSFNPSSSVKKSWKVLANAKGFGRTAITTSETKRRDEIATNNNKGNTDFDDDDKISSEVWDRMLVRILFYVGTPMVTGVVLLYVFGALKEQKIWDVPLWLPFLTTLLAFGTSAIGIAYGTLSTSLDPDKEGSLLGWKEAQQNWPELWKEEDDNQRR